MKETQRKYNGIMKTRYPIVLVHGAFVRNWLFFKCFGKIDNILRKEGYDVYVAKIDACGSIENNALQLKTYINKIIEKSGVKKVNLICHSKGGLDAKYMIDNLKGEEVVASITALCSPFKGTPVANVMMNQPKFMLAIENFFINLWYRIIGDKKPQARILGEQLKRVNSLEEPVKIIKEGVYYQSFSSSTNNVKDNFIDAIPLLISRHEENVPTDGLVPQDSTIFGNYRGKISEENLSHNQVIDNTTSYKKKKIVFEFYKKVAKELAERGF